MSRIRVVGLGNAWAGDDAVGLVASERLQRLAPAGVEVITLEAPDWRMFDGLQAGDRLVVIDACRDDSPPGSLQRLDIEALASLPLRHCSSHGMGLADWLAMAGALGEETGRVSIYAVSVGQTEMGAPLSPAVAQAVEALLPMLQEEIENLRQPLHQTIHQATSHA